VKLKSISVLCFLVAAIAQAQEESPEKQQARVLLGQGNALFERGDLKGALADFRAAYALYPSPKLLVNAAAAERELGDLPAAANDLRRFMDDAPEDDPGLVERAKQDLRSLERRLGRIALQGWPARSTFEIDGRAVRESSYVRPGGHHVHARAPNGVEEERVVSLSGGDTVEIVAPARAAALPTTTAPRETVPPKKKSRAWIAGVVVGVVAAAALGIGLGVGLTQGSGAPLAGDLGKYNFSMFK
jgi:tetratricopeptide (TPR) repeat protein